MYFISVEDKIAGPATTDSRVCVTLQFTAISRAHNNNRLYQQKPNFLAKATSSQGNEDVTTMTFPSSGIMLYKTFCVLLVVRDPDMVRDQ